MVFPNKMYFGLICRGVYVEVHFLSCHFTYPVYKLQSQEG